ncbi:MAG: glycosyltransferase family 9 protein [Candidatus Krumholzibacteria bacterium]
MKADLVRVVTEELGQGGRILVSRLQYLGDVILSLPLVQALRRRFPNAEIDYLTREQGAGALAGEAAFGRVFRLPEKHEGTVAMIRLVRELRRRRYSASIDLYSNPRSALLTWLSGAKLRIGGARRVRRHLYTHAVRVPPSVRAATEHHLYYAKCLGVEGPPVKPSLVVSDAERTRARETLASLGGGQGLSIGIHPGGKWEVKRWPVESFVSLAGRLADRGDRVVVLCGPGEEGYRDAVRAELGERAVYAPVLPVRDTAAIISELAGMVVCDGGMMHVSVAVDTPTVGIFGSSEPEVWFPYEDLGPYTPAWTPITCRPCHQHTCDHLSCLNYLTVDMVKQKLDAVLNRATSPGPIVRSQETSA